ncbi:MAG TPA: methylamine utilization protein, partial [Burkholderiaceae bacterium]
MAAPFFRLGLLALLFPAYAMAAALVVTVTDKAGQPLRDAVVYAETDAPSSALKPKLVQIEQRDRQFIPKVTVVQSGTSIAFPNNDTVRHHVYSFSPAKTFEVRLYTGVPKNPERFDKAGTVTLGCNIHDQMIAFVQVVDTPHFAKTDAKGRATLDLPAGKYELKGWHYNMAQEQAHARQAVTVAAGDATASFKLNVQAGAFDNDGQYQPKQYKY